MIGVTGARTSPGDLFAMLGGGGGDKFSGAVRGEDSSGGSRRMSITMSISGETRRLFGELRSGLMRLRSPLGEVNTCGGEIIVTPTR